MKGNLILNHCSGEKGGTNPMEETHVAKKGCSTFPLNARYAGGYIVAF